MGLRKASGLDFGLTVLVLTGQGTFASLKMGLRLFWVVFLMESVQFYFCFYHLGQILLIYSLKLFVTFLPKV